MKDIRVLIIFFTISTTDAIKQCPIEHDFGTDLLLVHEDCDKFLKCTFGHTIEMLCPAGLYFNPKILKCDWKENVDCKRNESGGDQAQSENSEEFNNYNNENKENGGLNEGETILDDSNLIGETSGHEFLENECPINSSSHWLLPHENNCSLFYYCVRGEKLQRQCPNSLHFNFHLQVCDWPDKAGCNDSSDSSFESEMEDSQEDRNSQENSNSQEDNNISEEQGNSEGNKNSQENENSQEDNNTSQEESQENSNSGEDYTSEEDRSDVDETIEDDSTEEPSYQKTKKMKAIVTVNLKSLVF